MLLFAPPYNTNVLLAMVNALSAAIAFVATLHLYARCFLQQRNTNTSTRNPDLMLALQWSPDAYEVEGISVVNAVCAPDEAAGLGVKELCALQVLVRQSPSAKEHCAACVGEMEDGELGKLLPACRHTRPRRVHRRVALAELDVPGLQVGVRTEQDTAALVASVSLLSY